MVCASQMCASQLCMHHRCGVRHTLRGSGAVMHEQETRLAKTDLSVQGLHTLCTGRQLVSLVKEVSQGQVFECHSVWTLQG